MMCTAAPLSMIGALNSSSVPVLASSATAEMMTIAENSAPVSLIRSPASAAPCRIALGAPAWAVTASSFSITTSRSSSNEVRMAGFSPKVPIAIGRWPTRSMKCAAALRISAKSPRGSSPVSSSTMIG